MGVIPHTPGEYPRYVHHAKKAPVLVHSKEEHQERKHQGFVDSYVDQAYPKHLHKNQHTRTVKNEAEEKALRAKGWKTTEDLQKAAAKGEGDKFHQLVTNPDGLSVPHEERWLQGPEEPDLDEEGELEPEPEPIAPKPRKARKSSGKTDDQSAPSHD